MVLQAICETVDKDDDDKWFGVKQIADESGASPATVSETLTELERRDWVESVGSGPGKLRRLNRPTQLLNEWTSYQEAQKPPKIEHYYVPNAKPEDLVAHLRISSFPYQITGEVAGQHYAPYLTNVSRLMTRYNPGLWHPAWLQGMGAKPVTEGWNLGLMPMHATVGGMRFRRLEDDAYYASPLQTYLDLLQGPGRAKDLARHLREQYLRY